MLVMFLIYDPVKKQYLDSSDNVGYRNTFIIFS